jgi:carbon-monoxide dehydrogenase medium subunit
VRNLATVGGNLAHGDPANDHPATMIALGAQVVATGPKGERVIAIDDFFVSLFTTSLAPDELLTEIRIPALGPRGGGAYFKQERKVGDFATAAVAVQLTLDGAGAVQKVGIGLTNVGPTPLRAKKAEDALRGKKPDHAVVAQAAQLASDDAQPSSDLRGPAEYKKGLIKELTKRALARALERAGK